MANAPPSHISSEGGDEGHGGQGKVVMLVVEWVGVGIRHHHRRQISKLKIRSVIRIIREKKLFYLPGASVCKSGLETDPRPRPDRKKTRKDRTGGPGLSLSK